MIIYFNDGGRLYCHHIEVNGTALFADEIYSVLLSDIESIDEGDEDEHEDNII